MANATTTIERLEALTDRAKFELLAQHVLRSADTRCAGLIGAGTNARGETVVSPVDGFGLVPGSNPPHFVLVESTTTDSEALRHKWLFDHQNPPPSSRPRKHSPTAADDGDLYKASRQAAVIRASNPSAVFTVFLATNQRVDVQLFSETMATAGKLQLGCEVWEQSRLAGFLDADPTGQYLRWKYLDETAQRLSAELLHEIGATTIERFARSARIDSDPNTWVSREVEKDIWTRLGAKSPALHLVVAESGFGKTVATYRLGKRWLAEMGFTLWIDETVLQRALSLNEAIQCVLKEQVPSLGEGEARAIPRILEGRSSLLLIFDDVSRAQQPPFLLRRITAWMAAAKNLGYVAVCPAWPRVRDAAAMRESSEWMEHSIGRFSRSEAEQALLRVQNAEHVATALGLDPFAIGLYLQLSDSAGNRRLDARSVIRAFVEQRIQSIQAAGEVLHTTSEHLEAVRSFASSALQRRELTPTAHVARSWLEDDNLGNALGEVIRHSAVLWEDAEHLKIAYRHDRIRDHLLSLGLRRLYETTSVSTDLWGDPFYSEIAAAALVDLGTPVDLLNTLLAREPMVLACALAIVERNSDAEKRLVTALRSLIALRRKRRKQGVIELRLQDPDRRLAQVLVAGTFNNWDDSSATPLQWDSASGAWRATLRLGPGDHQYKFICDGEWRHDDRNSASMPDGFGGLNSLVSIPSESLGEADIDSRAWAIHAKLAEIDSPAVLAVADDEDPATFPFGLLARCRNGDAVAGVKMCMTDIGSPSMRFSGRTEAIAAVKRDHLDGVMDMTARLARIQTNQDALAGVIIFAGHVGGSRVAEIVQTCWRASSSPQELLSYALWAMLAATDSPEDLVVMDGLWEAFKALPESSGNSSSPRSRAFDYFHLSRRGVVPPGLLRMIIEKGSDKDLRSLMWNALDGVDQPIAVETVVRWAAESEERHRELGTSGWGMMRLTRRWSRDDRRRMSTASLERLRALWNSPEETDAVRLCAFKLWVAGGGSDDVEALRRASDDPLLKREASWNRGLAGDLSVAPLVAAYFTSEEHWAHVVPRIWSEPIEQVADAHLLRFAESLAAPEPRSNPDAHHELARMLERIDPDAARRLLIRHWKHLRNSRLFVRAAIVAGGKELDALVTEVLSAWPKDSSPFQHFSGALFLDVDARVDLRLFEQVKRHVHRLDRVDAQQLVHSCRQRGLGSWARENLAASLPDAIRRSQFPVEEDFWRELDSLSVSKQSRSYSRRWAEQAIERGDGQDIAAIARRWLSSKNDLDSLATAIDVFHVLGDRSCIAFLEEHAQSRKLAVGSAVEGLAFSLKRNSLQ